MDESYFMNVIDCEAGLNKEHESVDFIEPFLFADVIRDGVV